MKAIKQASVVIVILSLIISCTTNRLTGYVVNVQDGDTMSLLTKGNKKIKIRLHGIDAPEIGQDFSQKSRNHLSDLVAGKYVSVIHKGEDRYGRVLGIVFVEKLNVNEEMICSGFAWRYKYNDDVLYLSLQEEAKRKRLNIWSMKNPIDPWLWRKNRQNKK